MGIFVMVLYMTLAEMLLYVLYKNIVILSFYSLIAFLLLLFSLPFIIILYLVHFTWNENNKIFGKLNFVENRYAQAQKALFASFTQLSGFLIIIGFLARSVWAYEHGIFFAPLNITEDLSFSAMFWGPTIISTAVILITYLFYGHYIARKIVSLEDWNEEEKIKINNIKAMVIKIAQMKLPGDIKKILSIWYPFFNNQKQEILFSTIPVFFSHLLYIKYDPSYYELIIISIVISVYLSLLYLPQARIIIWIMFFTNPIFLVCIKFTYMIPVADQYPQQYGGFRPEHYIAKWKGEDKEKRISVVYKTDKFLFCQPEESQKNPNWKCTILSTEGLERLVPDTQKQTPKQEPH